jgi:hypothetical protein
MFAFSGLKWTFEPGYKEAIMSTLNKGRSLDQQTRDGTSSIGTMGAGATGQRKQSGTTQGNEQSAGRTDDLLSGGVEEGDREHGFQTGPQYRQGEQRQSGPDTTRRSER